jgi:hypothetical protein
VTLQVDLVDQHDRVGLRISGRTTQSALRSCVAVLKYSDSCSD